MNMMLNVKGVEHLNWAKVGTVREVSSSLLR